MGYKICEDEALEIGYAKIALYISDEGLPTHAVRQLRSGMWTSKIGALADIQHKLQGLTGERYGKVLMNKVFMFILSFPNVPSL